MYQKFTKTKNLLTIAMLLVFCVFTNNVMAWDGNGTASNPWKIGDTKTNTATAVTAVLNGNTLTISGNGNMADFWSSAEGEAPWWFNTIDRNAIQSVIIENGVTNIGQRAFKDCSNLQSITIPNSVVKINEQAFYNCSNLLAIANLATTPQSVGSNAFQGINTAVIYLATPKEATAKYQTTNIWRDFKFVEPYVLIEENLSDNIDAIIYGLDGSAYYFENQNNNQSIPKRLTMYNGVGDSPTMVVDYNNDGLPIRFLTDGLTIIVDGYDENRCNFIALTSTGDYYPIDNITFDIQGIATRAQDPTDWNWKKTVDWTKKILKVAVSEYQISNPAIVGNVSDISLIISTLGVDNYMPESVKAIYCTFTWSFSTVSMVTSCSSAAYSTWFAGVPLAWPVIAGLWTHCGLSVISNWKSTTSMGKAWANWFSDNTGCSVTASLDYGVLTISGSGALCTEEINKYTDRKNEIKSLFIKSGVTSIPSYAFENCTNLTSIEFSNSSESLYLGSSMFSGSNSIQTVHYGRNLSGWSAPFQGKSTIKKVTFSNNITSIPANSFDGCTGLASVSNFSNVTSIGQQAFKNCSSLGTINIQNKVTEIGFETFYGAGLTNIAIPSSVISIGSYAFENCKNLTNVEFSNDSESLYLGSSMFSGTNSIQTVHYGRNLNGWSAPFQGKSTIKKVTFSNNITSIPANSFDGCTSLTNVSDFNNVTSIGQQAFKNCSSLGTINIQGKVTEIGFETFYGAGLTSITIPSSVTSVGSYAFEKCTDLTNVEFSNGSELLYLGSSMFLGANSIQTVHYGRNLSGWSAPFQGKSTIKKVTFSNNITSIPANSFDGCTSLTNVSDFNNVTSIGQQAFKNCSSLGTINIQGKVTEIGFETFYGTGLTSITIPSNLTSIGSYAFENCTNLTNVEFLNGSESLYLGSSMFLGANSIQTVHYGRNLSGWDAPFQGKTTLKRVTFNKNIASIPTSAFYGCTGLSQITCNATTPPTLQSNTFYNVSKSVAVYINCNYLSTYKSAQYWSEFTNYQCAVQVVSASNSAAVTFPEIDNATTYTLNIYSDENHTNIVKEIYLDANGKPKSAPAQNALKAETTFSCTVSGLSANTRYFYSLTPYNASGNMLTVFTGDFTTTASNGIENIVANQMSIYPNPAKHEIYIKSELQIEKVEIYSLAGSLIVLENNFTEKISVSDLLQGIYLLKVYTDKGVAISKIMKE